mgnify:CR=1 FL=1
MYECVMRCDAIVTERLKLSNSEDSHANSQSLLMTQLLRATGLGGYLISGLFFLTSQLAVGHPSHHHASLFINADHIDFDSSQTISNS